MMKKSFSFLLLAIFLFNTMGYYFVFKVNQTIIRREIRGIISSGYHKDLCLLVKVDHPCSNPDFKLLDHREFTYRGRLYDIVSETVRGDAVWYYCINDRQEEKLIAGFEKIQDLSPGSGAASKAKNTYALLYHLITIALIREPIIITHPQPLEVVFGDRRDHPVTPYTSPFSPPPEWS
jgi:hypothetical protein